MVRSAAAPLPLGVSLHTLDPDQQLGVMGLLAGSQVSSVELWEPTFAKDEAFVSAAREALRQAGVEVRSVHASFGSALDLSSPDEAVRAAGLRGLHTALDLAARMGSGMVIVHPSSEPIAPHDRTARLKRSRRSLQEAARMAGDSGCRLAIELLPRTCLGSSEPELLALLGDLDADAAGVCLDTNHLMGAYGLLPAMVRSLGPRLFSLHCSDYDGVDEKHWPPGRGVIDWAAFVAALRHARYTGPFHYEAVLDGTSPAERLAFLQGSYARLAAPG